MAVLESRYTSCFKPLRRLIQVFHIQSMVIRGGHESLQLLRLSTCLKGEGFTHSRSINTHPRLCRDGRKEKGITEQTADSLQSRGLLPVMGVNVISLGHGSNSS